mmetsp:Transcript_10850/g.15295  ORF Transcript_10850/g.15295 Transcript_10850/m.15295 type:complete len:275 (-) Transcript_10850:218-1042(-)
MTLKPSNGVEKDEIIPSYDPTTPSSVKKDSKLSAVIGDGSFETVMRERTKLRKEKDEHSIAELRVAMTSMDRTLAHEIRRRIESTSNVDSVCSTKISEMEERLNSIIESRFGSMVDRLKTLGKKIDELNKRLDEESANIPSDIEQRGKDLKDMVTRFQGDFSAERRDRLNREGRIMRQLADHAGMLGDLWNKEKNERENAVSVLHSKIDSNVRSRADADADFKALVERELASLKEDMARETRERKVEDDEIVEALNRYTRKLQSSLSVISSVEE